MKRLKQKLELIIYGYNAGAYLPIKREGKLENKLEFVLYKADCFRNKRIA